MTFSSIFRVMAQRRQKPSPVRILLIRHGQSEGQLDSDNYKQKGDDNLELTGWGKEQARITGAHLARLGHAEGWKEIGIHASTDQRSQQTVDNMIEGRATGGEDGIPFDVNEASALLDKQKFGKFDGLFTDEEREAACPEAFAEYQRQLREVGAFHARPPGGESMADMQARVDEFLDLILDGRAGEERTVAIVTHGTISLCIVRRLLGYDDQWVIDNQDSYANCSVHEIMVDAKGKSHDTGIIFTPPARGGDDAQPALASALVPA